MKISDSIGYHAATAYVTIKCRFPRQIYRNYFHVGVHRSPSFWTEHQELWFSITNCSLCMIDDEFINILNINDHGLLDCPLSPWPFIFLVHYFKYINPYFILHGTFYMCMQTSRTNIKQQNCKSVMATEGPRDCGELYHFKTPADWQMEQQDSLRPIKAPL